jgi:hypothetical protein
MRSRSASVVKRTSGGHFGVTLEGGVGFRAIAGLVGSGVEYRRMDALDVRELGEHFDVVLCFGILHRVTDPNALLRALAGHVVGGPERVEPEDLIRPIADGERGLGVKRVGGHRVS